MRPSTNPSFQELSAIQGQFWSEEETHLTIRIPAEASGGRTMAAAWTCRVGDTTSSPREAGRSRTTMTGSTILETRPNAIHSPSEEPQAPALS